MSDDTKKMTTNIMTTRFGMIYNVCENDRHFIEIYDRESADMKTKIDSAITDLRQEFEKEKTYLRKIIDKQEKKIEQQERKIEEQAKIINEQKIIISEQKIIINTLTNNITILTKNMDKLLKKNWKDEIMISISELVKSQRADITQQIIDQTNQIIGSIDKKFINNGELFVEKYIRHLNDNPQINSDIKNVCVTILNSFGFDIKTYCTILNNCKSRNDTVHEIYYDALTDESIDMYCNNDVEKQELKQIIKLLLK
jgi:hypothetical protein